MTFFFYNVTIFDTASDANLKVFPKIEPHTVIAENETEAQRQIVENLYDPEIGGTCARYARKDDSADRFHIVFDDPVLQDEVFWNPDLNDGTGAWDWVEPR